MDRGQAKTPSRSLEDVIRGHKPHPRSLLDDESKEAYNEEEARAAFGDIFIEQLKSDQPNFRGDWWQLALLLRDMEAWKATRKAEGIHTLPNTREYVHLESARLKEIDLECVLKPVWVKPSASSR